MKNVRHIVNDTWRTRSRESAQTFNEEESTRRVELKLDSRITTFPRDRRFSKQSGWNFYGRFRDRHFDKEERTHLVVPLALSRR